MPSRSSQSDGATDLKMGPREAGDPHTEKHTQGTEVTQRKEGRTLLGLWRVGVSQRTSRKRQHLTRALNDP